MPNPTPIPPGDGFDPTELERLHELILEHFLASARLATHLEAMRRSATGPSRRCSNVSRQRKHSASVFGTDQGDDV